MTKHEADTYAEALRETGRFAEVTVESYHFGANPLHYAVGVKHAGTAPDPHEWRWLYNDAAVLEQLATPKEPS